MGLFSRKKEKQEEPAREPVSAAQDHHKSVEEGLEKTKESVFKKLSRAVAGKASVDDEVLDNLEEVLITSDVGVDTTLKIIERIEKRVSRDKYLGISELNRILREEIAALLEEQPGATGMNFSLEGLPKPYVIMVVGVNGVGKTTTIAKLGQYYKERGKSVLFAAGDTFRAAGGAQLELWGERTGIPVISAPEGSDPAALAFDAARARIARRVDLLFVDTAGRLHTKHNLMEELKKVKRSIAKADPGEPAEVWLVLDATTGQNGIEQAKKFNEAVGLTGVIVTKLDGTAKGGVLVPIARELGIPIKFIGVGESAEDLQPFDAGEYVEALLSA